MMLVRLRGVKGHHARPVQVLSNLFPLSHALSLLPNRLKVLSLVPGLFASIPGKDLILMTSYSMLEVDKGLLWDNDMPANICQVFGYSMHGIRL